MRSSRSGKAVRLLCHEADVKERLDAPVAHRITAARNGIARILEVSLRQAGREALRLARESAQPGAEPARPRRPSLAPRPTTGWSPRRTG